MESKRVKVLNNEHFIVVDSKRKQAAHCIENISEGNHKAFFGKRKRPYGCESNCGVKFNKKSIRNYSNFMKSGLPERVLFYQDGEWKDFPKDIVDLAREEFKLKKAAIEVRSNGCHFMLDILYMIKVDLKTGTQKPIAWIDEAGGCFFPELHSTDMEINESESEKNEEFVEVDSNGTRKIKLHLGIDSNGINSCGLEECVQESNINLKRKKIEEKCSSKDLELGDNDDYYDEHIAENIVQNPTLQIENVSETAEFESIKKIFLEGMKPFFDVNIVDINNCASTMMQTRWEVFQKQAELTQKCRGNPNIHFAWFPASKNVLSSTMTYGFAYCGSKNNATYGLGVHLTSVKRAFASANYCDIDENGVRHMVFCRVILGNVELVRPGSTQFHPSSESFDNGVDNLQNPSHYIVWNMNMNTHIYPEYVVSFKMQQNNKAASLIGQEHGGVPHVTLSLDHQGNGQIGSSGVESSHGHVCSSWGKNNNLDAHQYISFNDLGNAPSGDSSTAKTKKIPFMPFSVLFDAISPKMSRDDMNKLYAYYEEMRSKKFSRQDFISKLRSIAGDQLLKTSILGLQNKFLEKAKCVPGSHRLGK